MLLYKNKYMQNQNNSLKNETGKPEIKNYPDLENQESKRLNQVRMARLRQELAKQGLLSRIDRSCFLN